MRVIHVLRKPTSEPSVGKNVLEHGTGGIHIDAARVAGIVPQVTQGASSNIYGGGKGLFPEGKRSSNPHRAGRWPTNMVLQHRDTCAVTGAKSVSTGGSGTPARTRESAGYTGPSLGRESRGDGAHRTYRDAEGKETVPDWNCASNCPVADLDEQSGDRPSTLTGRADPSKTHAHPTTVLYHKGRAALHDTISAGSAVYADSGGASRFFKQVGGKK